MHLPGARIEIPKILPPQLQRHRTRNPVACKFLLPGGAKPGWRRRFVTQRESFCRASSARWCDKGSNPIAELRLRLSAAGCFDESCGLIELCSGKQAATRAKGRESSRIENRSCPFSGPG